MLCAPALAHSYTFMPLSLHTSHLVHSPPSMLTLAHSHAHPSHTLAHSRPMDSHCTLTPHTPCTLPLHTHSLCTPTCTLPAHLHLMHSPLHAHCTHISCTHPSCTPTHSLAHTPYTRHAHSLAHSHSCPPLNKAPSATSGILGSECGILGSGWGIWGPRCGIWGLKLRF